MDFNKFFASKAFKAVTISVAALVIILLIFGAGVAVGYKKANFSFRWGENYHNNFGGPRGGFLRGGFLGGFSGRDFIDAHGVSGKIIKIDANAIVIQGRNDVERPVAMGTDTIIKSGVDSVKVGDLKIGDMVVVVGQPDNSGQIEAKLIRVMPAQPVPSDSNSPVPPPAPAK